MDAFIITLLFMGAMMLIMAVGVMFKRPPLKGSCGGVGGAECICEKQGIPLGTCDSVGEDSGENDGVKLYN